MKLRELAVWALVGFGAASLRVAYVFFPFTNLVDVVVFGFAGYALGRTHPTNRWVSFILVVMPAFAFIVVILTVLGPHKLSQGVGIGHLYGAVLIPLAAGLGLLAAGRVAENQDRTRRAS